MAKTRYTLNDLIGIASLDDSSLDLVRDSRDYYLRYPDARMTSPDFNSRMMSEITAANNRGVNPLIFAGIRPLPTGPRFEKLRSIVQTRKSEGKSPFPNERELLDIIGPMHDKKDRTHGFVFPTIDDSPDKIRETEAQEQTRLNAFKKEIEDARSGWRAKFPEDPKGGPYIEGYSRDPHMIKALDVAARYDIPIHELLPIEEGARIKQRSAGFQIPEQRDESLRTETAGTPGVGAGAGAGAASGTSDMPAGVGAGEGAGADINSVFAEMFSGRIRDAGISKDDFLSYAPPYDGGDPVAWAGQAIDLAKQAKERSAAPSAPARPSGPQERPFLPTIREEGGDEGSVYGDDYDDSVSRSGSRQLPIESRRKRPASVIREAVERRLPPESFIKGQVSVPARDIDKIQGLVEASKELRIHPWMFEEGYPVDPDGALFHTIEEIRGISKKLGLDPKAFAANPDGTGVEFHAVPNAEFEATGNKVTGPYAVAPYQREPEARFPATRANQRMEEGKDSSGNPLPPALPKLTLPAGAEGQFTNQPRFVSEAAKDVVQRAVELSREPHIPYPGERVVQPTRSQREASNLIRHHVSHNPFKEQYADAADLTRGIARGREVSEDIQPYLDEGTKPSYRNIDQYMSPYQDAVIDRMKQRASRDFMRHTLDPLQNRLIAKGMHNSSLRPKLIREALENFGESMAAEESKLRHAGYESAMGHSHADKFKTLSAGQLLSQTKSKDLLTRLEASKQLHGQIGAQEEQKLRQADLLRMLGTEEYNIAQQERDKAYEDYQEQKLHPYKQLAFQHELTRGLPVNTALFKFSGKSTPQPVVPSSLTKLGGLMQGIGGQMAKGDYAHGGQVKERYQPNPDEQDYLDQMEKSAGHLEKSGGNPMWDFISRMGFETAASEDPNWSSRLGKSALAASDHYDKAKEAQSQRQIASMNLRNKMLETKMILGRQSQEDQMKKEEKDFKKDMMNKSFDQKAEKNKLLAERQASKDSLLNAKHDMDKASHAMKMKMSSAKYDKLMKSMAPKEGYDPYANAPNDHAKASAYKEDLDTLKEIPIRIKALEDMKASLAELAHLKPIGPQAGVLPAGLLFKSAASRKNLIQKASGELARQITSAMGARAAGPKMFEQMKEIVPNEKLYEEDYIKVLKSFEDRMATAKKLIKKDIDRLKKNKFDLESYELPSLPSDPKPSLADIDSEISRRMKKKYGGLAYVR